MKQHDQLGLTEESVQMLLMQRADLRVKVDLTISRLLLKIFPEKPVRKFIFKTVLPLYYKVGLKPLIRRYMSSCEIDFQNLKPHLDINKLECKILDIGAGFSGISVFLFHFLGKKTKFCLLDRDSVTADWKIGYHHDANSFSSYNSFPLVKIFLKASGLHHNNVKTIDINKQPFPENAKFDIVISLLSMGYHYPIDVYADGIRKTTNKGAKIFLDLRDGYYNLAEVENVLNAKATLIKTSKNSKRYLLIRI